MINKRIIIIAGIALFILILASSFFIFKTPRKKNVSGRVSFFDLILDHKEYNNKEICTTGEYFSNFETAQLRPLGRAESNKNTIFLDISKDLEKESLNCDSSSRECKFSVLVCGLYESKINERSGPISYYGGISCPNCNSRIQVKSVKKIK
jgi:hypothetical protein